MCLSGSDGKSEDGEKGKKQDFFEHFDSQIKNDYKRYVIQQK